MKEWLPKIREDLDDQIKQINLLLKRSGYVGACGGGDASAEHGMSSLEVLIQLIHQFTAQVIKKLMLGEHVGTEALLRSLEQAYCGIYGVSDGYDPEYDEDDEDANAGAAINYTLKSGLRKACFKVQNEKVIRRYACG